MSILKFLNNNRRSSAALAKDRLTLILAHERTITLPYLDEMKQEIIGVVHKYTRAQKIEFRTDSNQNLNALEIDIILG